MEFFVAAVFDQRALYHDKILNFKHRFSPQNKQDKSLHLTLLPPFSIEQNHKEWKQRFLLNLTELIEDHCFQIQEMEQVEFRGIDFISGKKEILGLTPHLNENFFHLKEALLDFFKDEGAQFQKSPKDHNFLPLCKFDHFHSLQLALEMAKMDFYEPFILDVKSIDIFFREHSMHDWPGQQTLKTFNQKSSLEFFR